MTGDPMTDGRANLVQLALADGEAPPRLADLLTFVEELVSWRAKQLRLADIESAILYLWHDEMAGQLRTSLIAGDDVERLPFRGAIRVVQDAEMILQRFASSPYLHGIPWSELHEVSTADAEPDVHVITMVYVRQLSGREA